MKHLNYIENKIVSEKELSNLLAVWRIKSDAIVFTNGCFDIFHKGHASLLAKAASLGNRLIVAINSDSSIAKLKGNNRPINTLEDRSYLIAAMQMVDAVISFDDDTPLDLIRSIKPDVLAKGADYKVDEVIGKDIVESYGGKVELIELLEGYSTSGVIKKIKNS